ncbi:uncharacterized protein LOC128951603 [Oppia nitens]|uniref:uncharacterized protein LOC128951603 n=1 Tax=Oppia nitens TaxID=1686743 RepID=UPI0023DA6EF8|nr:uncharacterized protein LOC128951603 [Oppia nitens]
MFSIKYLVQFVYYISTISISIGQLALPPKVDILYSEDAYYGKDRLIRLTCDAQNAGHGDDNIITMIKFNVNNKTDDPFFTFDFVNNKENVTFTNVMGIENEKSIKLDPLTFRPDHIDIIIQPGNMTAFVNNTFKCSARAKIPGDVYIDSKQTVTVPYDIERIDETIQLPKDGNKFLDRDNIKISCQYNLTSLDKTRKLDGIYFSISQLKNTEPPQLDDDNDDANDANADNGDNDEQNYYVYLTNGTKTQLKSDYFYKDTIKLDSQSDNKITLVALNVSKISQGNFKCKLALVDIHNQSDIL